jgi:GAF domain-containing protein
MNPQLAKQIDSMLQQNETAQLTKILEMALVAFAAETGTIHRLDEAVGMLHLVAQVGLPPPLLAVVKTIPVGKGIAGQVVAQRRPVTICNLQTDNTGVAQPGAKRTGVGSALCVPIWAGDKILGTLGIGTRRDCEYTPEQTLELEEIGRVFGMVLK